ncbi:MAG: D-aminoacylase [bacterium]
MFRRFSWLVVPIVAVASTAAAQAVPYDLLIRNGRVIDGTGRPSFRADVAIAAGRVALVSPTPIPAQTARRVIDAAGRVVAPGFIDMHTHLEPLLAMPDAESHVRQGVTLAVGGPDGASAWPMGPFLDSASRAPLGLNVAFLVGHNTIREDVMGTANRDPTAAELRRMQGMVAQAMHDGAFGLSTGLRYIPGFYSKTAEVIALSTVAADSGGIYTSHMREEGLGLFAGVAEALEIGKQARIPVVLTHHKAVGRQMWGKSTITLAMVDSARRAGTDVMIDQYPYTASSTGLSILVPPWALAGGDSALRRRMQSAPLRDSILRGIVDLLLNDRGGGDLERVQFARVKWEPSLNGKTLRDLALLRGVPPTMDAVAPLIVEGVLAGDPVMVYHVLDEGDVKRIMAHPQTMIASDGLLTRLGDGVPHPRNYGTFPRVLGKYVREDHVLTLEQAVRKMTSMPASRLRLADRGCLRVGCAADVVVFDPDSVADRGTFADPHHYPTGIEWVIVNGVPVVEKAAFTAARPGQVLRREPGRVRAP